MLVAHFYILQEKKLETWFVSVFGSCVKPISINKLTKKYLLVK